MTRKHFEQCAAALATIEDRKARTAAAKALALRFHADNPRFDWQRFYGACGISWRVEIPYFVDVLVG